MVTSSLPFAGFGLLVFVVARIVFVRDDPMHFGSWRQAPRWARVLFGSAGGSIGPYNLSVELLGLIWAVGMFAVVVTGDPPGPPLRQILAVPMLAALVGCVTFCVVVGVGQQLRQLRPERSTFSKAPLPGVQRRRAATAEIRLESPLSMNVCEERLQATLDGKLPVRWLTWAGASSTARLVGSVGGDRLRVARVGPPTPAWMLRLPAALLRLPIYQSGLVVLTARLTQGQSGTLVSGSIRPPIGNLLVLVIPICAGAAILAGNVIVLLMAVPVVLLAQLVLILDGRRRIRADAHELLRRITEALDAEQPRGA